MSLASMNKSRGPTGVGPVLADGTPLGDLIDVERREVSMRVLSDPEIYQLELARLFRAQLDRARP